MEEILLEQEQQVLLIKMVEASRSLPRSQRQPFVFGKALRGPNILVHPGFTAAEYGVYEGDLETLARKGLLAIIHRQNGGSNYDITPEGYAYFDYMKTSKAPLERISLEIGRFIDEQAFCLKYPNAYQKWKAAALQLWSTGAEQHLTTIGHLCREAVQEFATALIEDYKPSNINPDKARIIDRMRSVLNQFKARVGDGEMQLLDALLMYWGASSDLIQRQEHGGQRERTPLGWEDGRRVVFQTAIIMFEIDRTLSSLNQKRNLSDN